jgi:hypothetical protein
MTSPAARLRLAGSAHGSPQERSEFRFRDLLRGLPADLARAF